MIDVDKEKELEDDQLSVTTRIRLQRYLLPEEKALKEAKEKNKILTILLVVFSVLSLTLGLLFGRLFVRDQTTDLANTKFNATLSIMENEWYFASDIDDIDNRLVDQALLGITSNMEDLHTTYMTAEEMEEFTQSINRSFVGIGVTFIQSGDLNMVEKVIKDSPAEKAGVLPGDIFEEVEGVKAKGLSADEIKELVQGDEGTKVSITFLRDGEYVDLEIIRGAVSATAYGYRLNDKTVVLQLSQFGDTTADESRNYLTSLTEGKPANLIIDLRDNGGGYLESLSRVASLFLPEDTLCMQQEYSDGTKTSIRTTKGMLENIEDIVIIVNANTASAAEVLTLALKEQRTDVTVIGTTTYGKGTVQVSKQFADGSVIKYTTSKWLSPNGVWVNGTGITPDEEVKLHPVMYDAYTIMSDDEKYQYDSVAEAVQDAQLLLDYLGYSLDRTDGYFSKKTEEALMAYQKDHEMEADGILTSAVSNSLRSAVAYDWNTSGVHDKQLHRAEEILNG